MIPFEKSHFYLLKKQNNSMLTLDEFIEQYDKDGMIVLLEGKRNVAKEDAEKLTTLGKLLGARTSKMIFRSGNADGADAYFSTGVAENAFHRLQVITPYAHHRKKHNNAYETIALDQIDLASEPEVVYQSKKNKKTNSMIDEFVSGRVNRVTIKAAYIIRDTVKVIGTKTTKPAGFAFFYDDLLKPETGGTGHTMNICRENNVPFIDQRTWMKWL